MVEVQKGPTGRIQGLTELLGGMTPDDVLAALDTFSLATASQHGYADSTDFDLIYQGRRFPPKAILGMAAERVVGRVLMSYEFTGGEDSPCFRILRGLGFEIGPKGDQKPALLAGRAGRSLADPYPFVVGSLYQRRDVFQTIGIEDPGGGPWYTGYVAQGDDWFIFCGVGAAGRTGHDYHNRFLGNDLLWYGKNGSSVRQPSIQGLLAPKGFTYIFCREDNRAPFRFVGAGKAKQIQDVTPVEVLWELMPVPNSASAVLPEEIIRPETVVEGAKRTITVNAYERDRGARERCIQHWGVICHVCGFDFERRYGELGAGFIHVHHLKPLADIGEEYMLDPVADLRPVCPNCHAMLHRKGNLLSISDLRNQIRKVSEQE